MKNISKSFYGIEVLHGVSLKIQKGTVHALMGENGAGKSTLMKILAGIHKQDHGEIFLDEKKISLNNPQDALNHGIAMIHQELSPVMEMTVGENIFLGREPVNKANLVNYKKLYEDAEILLRELNITINPRTKMKSLSVAGMQLVEIVKALSYDSKVIIMDEPTSAISNREVERLFEFIDLLKSKGKSIIYISHKMDEIYRISDEITIFRDGYYITTKPAIELEYDSLIKLMVGRELTEIYPKLDIPQIDNHVLSVRGLTSNGAFNDVSFDLKEGEILGLTGLMGAGRTEIAEAIFGVRKLDKGEIFIKGEKVQIHSPLDAINKKIAFVTEDRKDEGLFLPLSISKNISMSFLKKLTSMGFIKKKQEKKKVLDLYGRLKIKANSSEQKVESLSGGNQQKVVLAKWLLMKPDILILDEPTRGIDIGAKKEIYQLMSELVKDGLSIIMISSEMPEVLGMSDRVLVFQEGALKGELKREEATQEKILSLATSY
ncbi:sugar ABC transporter ATP-binding protein [Niallia sp. Krafla_26]